MKRRLAETTDRDLANALLRDGDEDAFRELYARHTGRLYQFVLRMLAGAEVEAEDVVQETWLRAVERLDGFRWESQLSTWLTGIGINLCRDRLRKRGREVDAKEGTVTPVVAPAVHEERIDLERAIALLPAGYREVLILHDVEGFTHGEIGERLGIAEGTSKSQLFFARRTMRRLLGTGRGNGRAGTAVTEEVHDG
jgi:RNA polymerase sigma-70 factor (ECF subfamily)